MSFDIVYDKQYVKRYINAKRNYFNLSMELYFGSEKWIFVFLKTSGSDCFSTLGQIPRFCGLFVIRNVDKV